jgi:hypothetical protein
MTSAIDLSLPSKSLSKSLEISELLPVSPKDFPEESIAKLTLHPLQIPYSFAIIQDSSSLEMLSYF